MPTPYVACGMLFSAEPARWACTVKIAEIQGAMRPRPRIDSDILIIDEENGIGKVNALLDEYRSEQL